MKEFLLFILFEFFFQIVLIEQLFRTTTKIEDLIKTDIKIEDLEWNQKPITKAVKS